MSENNYNIKIFADHNEERLMKNVNEFLDTIPAERIKDIKLSSYGGEFSPETVFEYEYQVLVIFRY